MTKDKATILIVDDEEFNRDMLGQRLKLEGFAIVQAENGLEALNMLEEQEIDLILLDVMMPGMDGIEVLRRIRKQRRIIETPVIMVTAKSETDDVVEALRERANDYITKPIEFEILMARVQTQLSRRRLLVELEKIDGPWNPAKRNGGQGQKMKVIK